MTTARTLAPLLLALLTAPSWSQESSDLPAPVRLAETSAMDPAVVELLSNLADNVEAAGLDVAAAAAAHIELALAFEANTMWTPALAEYEIVSQLLPDKPEWRFRKGLCQHALGDFDGALATLRQVAQELQGTAVVQARLGDLCLTLGLVEEAEAAWQAAIDSEKKLTQPIQFPQSRVGLAQVRYEQNRLDEAAELLREALALNPAYRHAHYLLGLILAEQGREEDAEFELRRGMNSWPAFPPDPHRPRLDPYSVGYHRRMMGIENQMAAGDLQGAMSALAQMNEEQPGDKFILNMMARGYAMSGRLAEAYQLLLESEAADADAQETQIELAVNLMNQANGSQDPEQRAELLNQAQAKADRAIQIAPLRGKPYFYRGLIELARTNNPDQQAAAAHMQNAQTYLQRAHSLGCTEPQLFENLAMVYANMGRTREMVTFAEQATRKSPENPASWIFLSRARYQAQDLDGALGAVERAVQLAPQDPQVTAFAQNLRQAVQQAKDQQKAPAPAPSSGDGR